MRKKQQTFKIVIALTAVTLIYFFFFATPNTPSQRKSDISQETSVIKVQEVTIAPDIITLGSLRALESVTLSSNVTEIISEIRFKDGAFIEQGDTVVLLTSAEEKARLNRAQKILNERRAAFERTQELLTRKVASRARFDEDQRLFEEAAADLDAVQASLEDRVIKAPFSGILGLRNISPGTLIEPGDAIVTLDKIDQLKLDFQLPSLYLPQIRQGSTVLAASDLYPGKLFQAHVQSINSRVDPATRTVIVRALIPNEESLLKPGLFMEVHVATDPRKTIMIPEISTLSLGDQKFVLLVSPENKIKQVRIKAGQVINGFLEVIEGLKAGDLIVYEGLQLLQSDSTIKANLIKIPQLKTPQTFGKVYQENKIMNTNNETSHQERSSS